MDNMASAGPGLLGSAACPVCGSELVRGAAGAAAAWSCPAGPHPSDSSSATDKPPSNTDNPSARPRLKDLISETLKDEAAGWPEWLLEELPEEQRRLLTGRRAAAQRDHGEGIQEREYQMLRDQGFVMSHDARGLRITGSPILNRGKGTGTLNPSDIIRLAGQMDGGGPKEVRRCPHCDANIPAETARCPWCGKSSSA